MKSDHAVDEVRVKGTRAIDVVEVAEHFHQLLIVLGNLLLHATQTRILAQTPVAVRTQIVAVFQHLELTNQQKPTNK